MEENLYLNYTLFPVHDEDEYPLLTVKQEWQCSYKLK